MRTRQSSSPSTRTPTATQPPRKRRGWIAVLAFAVLFYAIALLLLYLLIVTWGLVQQRLAVSPPSGSAGRWADAQGYPLTLAPAQMAPWQSAMTAVILVLIFVVCIVLARRPTVARGVVATGQPATGRPANDFAPERPAATKSASADAD